MKLDLHLQACILIEELQSYQKSNQPTTKGEVSKVEKKSDKMFAKLESTDDKNEKLVNEAQGNKIETIQAVLDALTTH